MLADVVKKAAKGLRAEPPSAATLAFLTKHHIPPRIIQTPRACSISTFVRVGRLTLYPFSALPKQNGKPMRDGELRGLQWQHIANSAPVPHLRVRQQLTLPRGDNGVTVQTPKSKYSKRDIPLHPLALAWLEWWHAEGWGSYVGRKPEADDYVFPPPGGEMWRPRDAEILRDDLEAAKLSKDFVTLDGVRMPFVFHHTRHTFSSWLGAAGVDGELVDRLLGQSPLSVRGRHYSAPNLEASARAVATIALALPERGGVKATHPEAADAPEPAQSRPEPLSPALSLAQEEDEVDAPNPPELWAPPTRVELVTFGLGNRCSIL
jgi:Phage integrase family